MTGDTPVLLQYYRSMLPPGRGGGMGSRGGGGDTPVLLQHYRSMLPPGRGGGWEVWEGDMTL